MARPKKRETYEDFDLVLTDQPEAARWREWMGRVEAVIFAARNPVPRDALARVIGSSCNLDDLIADIREDCARGPMRSFMSLAAISFAPSRVSRQRSGRRAAMICAMRARPS